MSADSENRKTLTAIVERFGDPNLFVRVFVDNAYELGLPPYPSIIVDCNANTGYSVLWFRKRFPKARIIVVEPDRWLFGQLTRNCEGLHNVTLLNANISDDAAGNGLPRDSVQPVRISLATLHKTYGCPRLDILKVRADNRSIVDAAIELAKRGDVGCILAEMHNHQAPGSISNAPKPVTLDGALVMRRRNGDSLMFRSLDKAATRRRDGCRNIWLISDGRSGSTWFAELLDTGSDCVTYFEPMHSIRNFELAGEPLIRHFPPGGAPPHYVQLYRRIFSKNWSLPVCGPMGSDNKCVLVKDIHAMLIAGAMVEEIQDVELVCLVRSPVEVARSKLSLRSWRWFGEPAQLLDDGDLERTWLLEFSDIIRGARTEFEKYVILWAIMYYVVKRQFGDRIKFVKYSDIVDNIILDVTEIRRGAGLPPQNEKDFMKAFNNRSGTDNPDQKVVLKPTEVQYAEEIVEAFGLGDLI